MKASLNWLKEFIDLSLTAAETAEALTMAGLEVESIEEHGDDSLFEINITPNRPDCLSIRGIARDLSAILNLPLKDIPVSIQNEDGVRPLIEINDPDLCPRYSSRIINGIDVKPSETSGWISKRLELHGFRPTNNIVDITNYVLLEMGHPLHAFDLDKLDSKTIVVKTAGPVKKFTTLDNSERTLNKDMLLIWDAKKPVAIAGVMGGIDSEVTFSTKNIFLESAYFDPLSIRRTSRALNLSTEASYRFERETDLKNVVQALDRATQLITEIAGGRTTRITDIYLKPQKSRSITIKLEKINSILGIKISPSIVQKILTGLGIDNKISDEMVIITPPSFRQDIQTDMDIVEEIARIYGYDKIPVTLPKVIMQPVVKNTKRNFVNKLKSLMCRSGYSEAINYSFLSLSALDKLKLSQEDIRRDLIKIRNPLKTEEESLRTTLIPALLENVRLNTNRGERSVRLFEISSIFLGSGQKLPDEVLKLSAVLLKDSNPLLWQDKHEGFYDLKGSVENLLLDIGIKDYAFEHETSLIEPYLHPGKSCTVKVNGKNIIGVLGTLHPDVAQNFSVNQNINIFELDIVTLFSSIPSKITYAPIPKYPYAERDLAIVVSEDTSTADVENIIRKLNSDMIESIKLFDIYIGKPVPKNKKSLAFSIRYRAGDRTLTDSEVNELHSRILNELANSLNAELRS